MNTLIRDARKRAGLTQDEVARRTGQSLAQVSKLENGKLKFTVDWLLALSDCFNVPVTALLPPEYSAVPVQADTHLLAVCIRAVHEEIGRGKTSATPEEIAHLTAALYGEMVKLGNVPEQKTVLNALTGALLRFDPNPSPQT